MAQGQAASSTRGVDAPSYYEYQEARLARSRASRELETVEIDDILVTEEDPEIWGHHKYFPAGYGTRGSHAE